MFSSANKKSLATALAGAAIASAMAVSGASAMPDYGGSAGGSYQDLRSPDAVDAASNTAQAAPPPSSIAASAGGEYKDLRLPDTRARAVDDSPAVGIPVAVEAPSEPSGFDLVSATIGAAAAAGLSLLLLTTLGMRRHSGRRTASA